MTQLPATARVQRQASALHDAIDPELKRLIAAVLTGVMAAVLDTTIISVGIRRLGTALQASVSTIQWVSTAYLLAMFVAIPLTGWAQARLGSKRLWLVALTVFTVGSGLCALAWDAPSLIAFRAFQGLGGGVMMPLMSTVLMQAAGGRNLGRLMAAVSLPIAIGPILGPVVGGVILNYLSWHWMFLVNLPLGVIGLVLAVRLFPAGEAGRPTSLDVVGVLLVSPGVVGVIYGLSQVGESGGFARPLVMIPIGLGLVLLAVFGWWGARRRERALLDVRLFRHRSLTVSSALIFLMGVALYGAMLLLPLYWQEVRGADVLGAGLLLVPQGIGALASRTLAGRLTDSIGGRWVAVVGFAVVTVATLPFALAGDSTATALLLVMLFVRGLGLGAVTIPLMTSAYVGLTREEIPDASIVTRVAQQLGGSLGTAVLAVVVSNAAVGARGPGDLAQAFDHAFWWATAFAAFATILSMSLPRPVRP